MYSQASTSHYPILWLTPQCRPHSSRCNRHLHTSTSTAAPFTAFTAALSTDIYSATGTSSAAYPCPGSTTEHAATASHVSDGSTTAAAANTSADTAFHTVTAANTASAAAHTTSRNHVYITTCPYSIIKRPSSSQ